MRKHEARPVPGEPNAPARQAVDVHAEVAIGVDDHGRNEELGTNLEEEERAIAIGAEPVAMTLNPGNNLILGETEKV